MYKKEQKALLVCMNRLSASHNLSISFNMKPECELNYKFICLQGILLPVFVLLLQWVREHACLHIALFLLFPLSTTIRINVLLHFFSIKKYSYKSKIDRIRSSQYSGPYQALCLVMQVNVPIIECLYYKSFLKLFKFTSSFLCGTCIPKTINQAALLCPLLLCTLISHLFL